MEIVESLPLQKKEVDVQNILFKRNMRRSRNAIARSKVTPSLLNLLIEYRIASRLSNTQLSLAELVEELNISRPTLLKAISLLES